MAEYMFLGLRMKNGVSISQFKKEFNIDLLEKYKNVIDNYKEFIIVDKDRISLTTDGFDISNMIFTDML